MVDGTIYLLNGRKMQAVEDIPASTARDSRPPATPVEPSLTMAVARAAPGSSPITLKLENEESPLNKHRIATVSVLPANMLNSFILVGERPILVDSGMPGGAPKILAALAREGFAPSDVSLILITHRHVDHIGSAAELQRATRAPVAVHALDADWLRRGDGGTRPPTGLGARLFDMTGIPGAAAEPCEPEIVIDGDFDLAPFGAPGGVVLHTPGHTPGSVSALFPNGDVLAGDLAIGGITALGGIAFKGHVKKPPFEGRPRPRASQPASAARSRRRAVLRRSRRPAACQGRAPLHRPRTPDAARPPRRLSSDHEEVRSIAAARCFPRSA